MSPRISTRLLVALLILAGAISRPAQAWLSSATLQYSCTTAVTLSINGVEIKNPDSAHEHFTDYGVISSADGSLPLELFRPGQPNVLAISQRNDVKSSRNSRIMLSYRLTLQPATGPAFWVEGKVANTRCLFLGAMGKLPESWNSVSFDDRAWPVPKSYTYEGKCIGAEMPLLNEDGNPGSKLLPFLSHNVSASGSGGDCVLYRTAFEVPVQAGGLRIHAYQSGAKKSDKIALALVPDRMASALGDLEFTVQLPVGVDPLQAPGAQWIAAERKLIFRLPSPVKFTALNLDAMDENHGFSSPSLCLGPWKTDRLPERKGMTEDQYWSGAEFPSGTSAWFRMTRPAIPDGSNAPVITGVSFQTQMLPGGKLTDVGVGGVDNLTLNYSVNGANAGALKEDARLAYYGGLCTRGHWVTGYYRADQDRAWTWKDLASLKVLIKAEPSGPRHFNKLLSAIASVRYYTPADAMPRFYVQVSEAACKTLELRAQLRSPKGGDMAQASLAMPVNATLCGGAK